MLRATQEMLYCERILAKSGTSVLNRILPAEGLLTWKHYPEPDVFDPENGAQWYYHCHDDSADHAEHGHFHCFVRPQGREGTACHLIAVGVNARSQLTRIFTVNQWVVGGEWHDASTTNALLDRFNVEMAKPDYLVNRWLTAVISRYEDDIIRLNIERDEKLAMSGLPLADILEDRSLEVISEQKISVL